MHEVKQNIMRNLTYISGVLGGLLLVIRLIGSVNDFKYNDLFLISGLVLIVLIFIPLVLMNKYKHNKKIDNRG